jgi:PAS domain S-box-containing protein
MSDSASLPPDSDLQLRLVLDSVTDYAIFTINPEGLVTSWNAGAANIFGYVATEIIGRNSSVIWTDEDIERRVPEEERRVANEKGRADDERWHRRKDGTLFFANGGVQPMRDESGRLCGFSKVCRDITSQREAEQELAEARLHIAHAQETERARLAEVFEQSPSFMAVVTGPDHVFELSNDNYNRLVAHREIIGKSVRVALPEVVSQGFIELLDRVYKTGEEFVGKNYSVLIRKERSGDFAEHVLDFVYRPIRDHEGRITGIFVHGNDITERVHAEKQQVRLAHQLHLALDAAQMGWWQYDVATEVVTWDRRAREIFGTTEPELNYTKLLDHIHPDDRPHVKAAVAAAMRLDNPVPYSIEYRVMIPPDSIRWVQANGQAYNEGTNESPGAVSFVGTVADVTDQRIAENALRESEARFRQLADAMPQIVFQAQPDGHVDYFNRRWYEYTGLPPGSTGYESWKHVHEPAGMRRVMEVWPEALRTGSPYEIEYRLRRADGQFRWHLGRALPVKDAEGNVIRWYGTNTDIHEQKQLQEQNEKLLESERAARSEAERASRMKDDFLATLSHELRTPLNAILGWAAILRGSPDAEDVAQGVEVIERNARAQTQIIADLLEMSRIISGKVRLEIQNVDLAGTISAAIDTIRPAANVKAIRIETTYESLGRPMLGDASRLQQVFWNLLSNAVKFTPRGGVIRVALRSVQSHVEVSIVDTGEGIAPDFLPFVFDRFRQADGSTTRRHGGLGLGLAIVRQLVELHGGSVQASSPGPGKGSHFTVSLPIAPLQFSMEDGEALAGMEPGENRPHIPKVDLSGTKILVVDDEGDARAMLTRLLEGCGATVRSAASAEEAMTLIGLDRPDLLVSDIGMPGEDGYSLIKRLRAMGSEEGGAIPAVALTAYARSEDRARALLSGFQFHVTKPVEPAELLGVIAGVVNRPAGQ